MLAMVNTYTFCRTLHSLHRSIVIYQNSDKKNLKQEQKEKVLYWICKNNKNKPMQVYTQPYHIC